MGPGNCTGLVEAGRHQRVLGQRHSDHQERNSAAEKEEEREKKKANGREGECPEADHWIAFLNFLGVGNPRKADMINKWNILLRKLTPRCYSLGSVQPWGSRDAGSSETNWEGSRHLTWASAVWISSCPNQRGKPICVPSAPIGSPFTLTLGSAVEVEWQTWAREKIPHGLTCILFCFVFKQETAQTQHPIWLIRRGERC